MRKKLVASSLIKCALIGQFAATNRVIPKASALCVRAVRLGWAMADEFDKQLERIENTVAEIVEAVRKLRDDRAAAGEAAVDEVNERLRRFLGREKQA